MTDNMPQVTILTPCPECGQDKSTPVAGELVTIDLPGRTALFLGREQIIAKLAAAFGPHVAPVARDTGNPRRDRGRFDMEPDGNDEQGSATLVFPDTDGHNSMRPLTYGEIADALTEG